MPTALITGATKGIGLEIARQLGGKGFHIILSGRSESRLQEAVDSLLAGKIRAEPLLMDVSDPAAIEAAYRNLSARIQQLDVLVNNAGILLDEQIPLLEVPTEVFQDTFQTNAFGAFFTARTFLPLIPKGGRVVNVSSGAGQIATGVTTWAPVYSMSKTLLNAITLQLASVLKPRDIAVNAICPGWVRTDMGGRNASRSVSQGAETAVWLATEAPARLTGKFFRDKKEISW